RIRPIGDEWTVAKGEAHPYFGAWSISWSVVCQTLYIPCIYALYMERRHSCYRIMLYLSFVDFIALISLCAFGFILIEG
ncbi:hypothetical protein PENTCL1PPCAC_4758, partial [Pristionchus entomophagus]